MKDSVRELVLLAKDGDQDAIAQLYEMNYNSVYQSVRAVLKDEDAALDIVQDSFIKGFQNLNKLSEPEKFQPWMKTLAANQARDYLRKKRPALFSERVDEEGEEIDLQHPDDCVEHQPEAVLDQKETVRLIHDILDTLKEEQRLPIIMYYYEDRSVREIAETLGTSENTVKSRLKYARDKIETEVRKLEKKGVKLYSLAPIPFFVWMLRAAKKQGISFVLDGGEVVAAQGVEAGVAAAGKAAATADAVTATGEATAGGAFSGKAAVGAAAKSAGKAVAKKVIAGTLAVTMATGTGAVVVNNLNKEKANKEAHVVYEEFLDRYQEAFEMDESSRFQDNARFWSEISEDYLEQHPEIDLSVTNQVYLDYIPGEDLEEGVPVPDTLYEPNMNALSILTNRIEGESVCYAYYDIDGNDVDELFVSLFYRGELQWQNHLDVYAVKNGKLLRGKVDVDIFNDGENIWELICVKEADYIDPGIIHINMGKGFFDEPISIDEPMLDWQELCAW